MKKIIVFLVAFLSVITLGACKSKNETITHQVEFNSNGGSVVNMQYIADNDFIKEPANPTYEGKVFQGWYLEENGQEIKIIFRNYRVRKNLKLVAKWQ